MPEIDSRENTDFTQYALIHWNKCNSNQWFFLPFLQPNTGCFPIKKRPLFVPISERFFSQPEAFIGIYSQILKAQAVTPKRQ